MVSVSIPEVDALRTWADGRSSAAGRFGLAVLRALPPEARGGWAGVRPAAVAQRLHLPEERLMAGLRFLEERGLVRTRTGQGELAVEWLVDRAERAPIDRAELAAARGRPLARLAHMLAYVEGVGCRRRHLLAYFGEPAPAHCGRCDVCLGRHRPRTVTPADEPHLRAILAHVAAGDARPVWLAGERVNPRERDALADWLLKEGLLELEDPLADGYALTARGRKEVEVGSKK
jgi:ATP-dependent DNA helicase RecQ